MKYQLFLCDFDGTLVRDDGTVTQTNIQAIAAYKRAGGKFIIVTGRMLASIRKRLGELGLTDGLVVAYQGAMIADIATGKILKDGSSPCENLLPAVKFMESMGLHVQVYVNDVMYSADGGELFEMYEKVCGVKGALLTEPASAFLEREKPRITKALAICEPKYKAYIHSAMSERFGREFFIADSAPYLVEIIPKDMSKGAAVGFLSEYYGVPREKIAAIGDQEVDIPMVREVGGKFAVANAVEHLKEIAVVVPSCEEDGVAFAIENYAMGEET